MRFTQAVLQCQAHRKPSWPTKAEVSKPALPAAISRTPDLRTTLNIDPKKEVISGEKLERLRRSITAFSSLLAAQKQIIKTAMAPTNFGA
jgi:hypothetical protein